MWEDARNRNGGRWIINLDKKRRAIELDRFWLEMVCCMVLVLVLALITMMIIMSKIAKKCIKFYF